MPKPCFNYFSIDVGDIWDFESALFLEGNTNKPLLEILLEKVKTLIIEKAEPSVWYDLSQSSKDSLVYYNSRVEKYLSAQTLQDHISINFFIHRDDLYQYGHPIVIEKEERDFDYWFALKLRQYDMGLKYLDAFLKNHLTTTFLDAGNTFKEFLELLLLQYKDEMLSERVCALTQKFMDGLSADIPKKTKKTEPIIEKKRPRALANFHSFRLTALRENPRYLIRRKHEIKEVFTDLMDHGFIKEKSSFVTFESLLSNQKIPKDKRLIWVGKYIYLKLFIRFLLTHKKIEPMGNYHWVIMTQCFVDEDGSELDIIKVSKANGGTKGRVERLQNILGYL